MNTTIIQERNDMSTEKNTMPIEVRPAEYTIDIVQAMQALERGEATHEQQIKLLDWIIKDAAGTYDLPYFGERTHAGAFACGKAFVGKQIVKLISLNTKIMNEGTE